MKIPLQVTFRNIPRSEAIEATVSEKAAKLDRLYGRIMSCRVVIEELQHRRHQGNVFGVRIDMTVPGRELVVTRQEHEDVYVAIRDAFDAAARLVEEHGRKRHGAVKLHVAPPKGRIARVFPESDYGFIKTSDNREVYFHRNSLIDGVDFQKLKLGMEVTFVEEQGAEGPQAARVAVDRAHYPAQQAVAR